MKTATLVVTGNIVQALEAVLVHRILCATSMVEHPPAREGKPVLTRIRVDGERYNSNIAAWLNEPYETPIPPGVLLRAQWQQAV